MEAKFDKKLKKKEKQLKAMRLRDIRPLRAQELMEEEQAAERGEAVVRVTRVLDEAEAERERKFGTIHGAPRTLPGDSERGDNVDSERDMETTTSMMDASTVDGDGSPRDSSRRRRVSVTPSCA